MLLAAGRLRRGPQFLPAGRAPGPHDWWCRPAVQHPLGRLASVLTAGVGPCSLTLTLHLAAFGQSGTHPERATQAPHTPGTTHAPGTIHTGCHNQDIRPRRQELIRGAGYASAGALAAAFLACL